MFLKYHLPALVWALFILIICGIPGNRLPDLTFLEWLKPDKIVHLLVFGILVYFVIRSFTFQSSINFLHEYPRFTAIIISICYGVLIEVLQEYVFVHRSGDVRDAIANTIGVFIGLWYYNRKIRKASVSPVTEQNND